VKLWIARNKKNESFLAIGFVEIAGIKPLKVYYSLADQADKGFIPLQRINGVYVNLRGSLKNLIKSE
jgi:hypothetical protein